MSQAIPVSASSANPSQPVGELIAEIFWVTAQGQIAREFGRIPVENGVATFDGPSSLPAGLFWAITILRSSSGAAFRSGPLDRLPGPPSPIEPNGTVSFVLAGLGFSLTDPHSDGAPELVAEHLRNLPPPLEFASVDLGADESGNYVITVRGRLRIMFILRQPFAYRRSVRLEGSADPGHPTPPVLARLVGVAAIRGANVRPQAAILDHFIKDAVERQLDVAVTRIAGLLLQMTGASFDAQTVSASDVRVFQVPTSPRGAQVEMTLSGGAITGVVLPPTPVALDQT